MNLKQAFIATYYFLDSLYCVEIKSEELIDLLSSMNPFLWSDLNSASPVTYQDWLNCAKILEFEESINSEQAYSLMLEFLSFHYKEFNFVPMWIIEDVKGKTYKTPKWVSCISVAMESPPRPLR